MDLFKLLHGFVKVVLSISRPLPNKAKLKFEQDFKAFWRFCFELKVLNGSMYSCLGSVVTMFDISGMLCKTASPPPISNEPLVASLIHRAFACPVSISAKVAPQDFPIDSPINFHDDQQFESPQPRTGTGPWLWKQSEVELLSQIETCSPPF